MPDTVEETASRSVSASGWPGGGASEPSTETGNPASEPGV